MIRTLHSPTLVAACVVALCCSPRFSSAQTPLHDETNLEVLTSLNGKGSLSEADLKVVREAMLTINNEARLNPEYRQRKGLKNDLTLPANLAPLVLDDVLNAAAQTQAEAQAGLRRLAPGTQAPGLMATGRSSDLAAFPVGWQSSEQTYRPTWNLGGSPVDSVGYGVAKSGNTWSIVAIWADRGGIAVKESGLHTPALIVQLSTLSDQAQLDAAQLQTLRDAMLKLNNEARANPEYRKKVGAKQDLDLPTGLAPLVLDDAANKAAQEQADYQAVNGVMTHENRNYPNFGVRMTANGAVGGLEACGVSMNLQDFPLVWMKSDTHYRPTWNIIDPVNRVGFGAAKNARDGKWYVTAVWLKGTEPVATPGAIAATDAPKPEVAAQLEVIAKPDATEVTLPPSLKTVDGNPPVGVTLSDTDVDGKTDPAGAKYASLRKGAILYKGQSLPAARGGFRLIITDAGAVAIVDEQGTVKWSAGEGGTHVEYQSSDGNVCLYDDAKQWKWGTQVYGPTMLNGQIRITADGVLEQLDEAGQRAWSSN